jgi:hypothetical protein
MQTSIPKGLPSLQISARQSLNEKYDLVHLGRIEARQPAFLSLTESPDGTSDLYISGFSVLGGGNVSAVQNVAKKLTGKSPITADLITEKIDWPNEISPQPLAEAGSQGRRLLAVPSGFLVPGRSTGGIYLMATQAANPGDDETFGSIKITQDKAGWFYHRAEWVDMNEDGRLDLITARAKVGFFGKPKGEMIWLEQPESPLAQAWKEHPLESPGDVHFRTSDLNQDGHREVLSAQFFQKNIVFSDSSGSVVIDDQFGSPFDLEAVDLNGDGQFEVLASNHEAGSAGKVVAYEVPSDPQQPWKRRVLLENIEVQVSGVRSAAPGQAHAVALGQGAPWILVSGDGSGKAHLLEPGSEWSYQEHVILDAGCTVGQSAVADVNHDGLPEIFVPLYGRDEIEVFSVVPKGGTGLRVAPLAESVQTQRKDSRP